MCNGKLLLLTDCRVPANWASRAAKPPLAYANSDLTVCNSVCRAAIIAAMSAAVGWPAIANTTIYQFTKQLQYTQVNPATQHIPRMDKKESYTPNPATKLLGLLLGILWYRTIVASPIGHAVSNKAPNKQTTPGTLPEQTTQRQWYL